LTTKSEQTDGVIVWGFVLEDAGAYTQSAPAGSNGTGQETIAVLGPTDALYLDIPALREEDSYPGFYSAMRGVLAGWRGASVYDGPDNLNFAGLNTGFSEAVFGTAETVLADATRFNYFEYEAVKVTVRVGLGQLLYNADRAALANGANAALIGNEVVQFLSATSLGGDAYELSGLLRGRLGTEWAAPQHLLSERFVLLDNRLLPVATPSSSLNAARYVRAVSLGAQVVDAASTVFVNTGRKLKPFAPVDLRGQRNGVSGDWTLTWVRRARLGGAMRDGRDVPIVETNERYEVDIYSAADFLTKLRTISGLTSTSAAYTAVLQIADFGSTQNTVHFRTYQLSGIVGRGYSARASITGV
jgi:hypothetical protein